MWSLHAATPAPRTARVWGQRGRQPMQDRKQTQGGVLESWPRPHKKTLHCCTDISEKAIGTTEPQKSRLSEGWEENLCSGPLLFPVPVSCMEQLNPLLLFGHSTGSNSLWLHELQHARLPCPSPTPRVCSNLSPLSWWCHPTISSYVIPFSSCPQSFPASGSFQWGFLNQVAKVLEFQLQHQSFQRIFTTDFFFKGTGWIS